MAELASDDSGIDNVGETCIFLMQCTGGMQELAALEAEAEALALQEQHFSGNRDSDAGLDLNRYSVSLADDSRSADRAMVGSHLLHHPSDDICDLNAGE